MINRLKARQNIPAVLIMLLLGSWVGAETPKTDPASANETREAFLKIIDRPRVDLAPEVQDQTPDGDIAHFHFTYASDASQRVPGILLIQNKLLHDGARHPAVIVLHGTGGKKETELKLLKQLALKGFVAVAIDGRYHGERGNQADYNAAIAKAFSEGGAHPLYYDTVWDILRLIDYLQTRPDIDAKRIGMIGFSKGGIETWLAAAVDPRIAVAVPCISLQSFQWALENDRWHNRIGTVKKGFVAAAKSAGVENPGPDFVRRFYDRVIPGIYDRFDAPVMVTLIAPRPLLGISGENDPINALPGVRLCEQAAKAAYEKAGVSDRFDLLVEPNTGHNVTSDAREVAIKWFTKWLEPDAGSK